MKVIHLADHYCKNCKMAALLDGDRLCEFCRKAKPAISDKLAQADTSDIYKLFLVLLLIGSLIVLAGNYAIAHF